jgi:Subtilase family
MSAHRNVTYSTVDDGSLVAHRTGEIITDRVKEALQVINELVAGQEVQVEDFTDSPGSDSLIDYPGAAGGGAAAPPNLDVPFARIINVRDPVTVARQLVARGFRAQPNHVHHAHLRNGANLLASPAYATPAYATPAYATPAYATPAYATPAYATPAYATPASSPASRTDALVLTSSALPAAEGPTTNAILERLKAPVQNGAYVFVLDTGLIQHDCASNQLRPLLEAPSPIRPLRQTDARDQPGNPMPFAAGHGTFIATLISQLAPGCRVAVGAVLENSGTGDEWCIARRISALATGLRALSGIEGDNVRRSSILSLSFGATALDNQPFLLDQVVRNLQSIGVLVVASAGDAVQTKKVFPAALPGVVGVGALGPTAPAPFTNSGPWVTACAPGIELVSAFFGDPGNPWTSGLSKFEGWAIWSGTSFSAPLVAGALARYMIAQNFANPNQPPTTAHDAKKRLIDAPWLMRVPNLGTAVNVV